MKKRLKRIGIGIAITLGVLVLAIGIAMVVANEPRPEGRAGADAEALAARMEAAVDLEAWARTRAVRWDFGGRQSHLWDRERGVARVRWGGDLEALVHVGGSSGRAYRDGEELSGAEAREVLEQANAHWINDSFWLNPIAKIRDDGVTLSLVESERGEALLVSYSSGGLTPGDAYLWHLSGDGTPSAWQMWVSIIPVGGVETTWAGWETLSTGARVSTEHEGPFGVVLRLENVAGAETLEALLDGEPDPFAPLFE